MILFIFNLNNLLQIKKNFNLIANPFQRFTLLSYVFSIVFSILFSMKTNFFQKHFPYFDKMTHGYQSCHHKFYQKVQTDDFIVLSNSFNWYGCSIFSCHKLFRCVCLFFYKKGHFNRSQIMESIDLLKELSKSNCYYHGYRYIARAQDALPFLTMSYARDYEKFSPFLFFYAHLFTCRLFKKLYQH